MYLHRLTTVAAAIVVLLGVASISNAQAVSGKAKQAGGKLKSVLAQLDLSAAQKAQIKAIVEKYKIAESSSGGGTANRADHKAQTKGLMKEILGVLTPQQKRKLMTLLKSERRATTRPA